MEQGAKDFLQRVEAKNPGEREFLQAVQEVVESVWPLIERTPRYRAGSVLERMVEPERIILFRVPWTDDQGTIRVNRGFRVEMNSALGPYKGGLRFHPSVNLGILKFLAFEQVFKNSLTTLPMGGGKGGSDFDPKGKSDGEVMRFCQSFMADLYRHLVANTVVPAGDSCVGGREIGYLFGMYKKLANEFTGVLTGKGRKWGGSLIRPEATGYGTVYFAEQMLASRDESLADKRVTISGSGNVAQYAAEKVLALGGTVLTMSDSNGTIVDDEGIDREKLDWIMDLKNNQRGRIARYVKEYPAGRYLEGQRPWSVPCDVALPCATENEISEENAETLLKNGCTCVAEGANMPSEPGAVHRFLDSGILYAPGKAANAGGVAVSGLEMTQNAMRLVWTREEVDERLQMIMKGIHDTCVRHGEQDDGTVNYVAGANIAGFINVADAMLDQGVV
ncbi:MAG: NADP-specific glutamate dehydrogenase [Thermoanaerobaculia bacterium]|nr:NADP-specific glutamate dehydrogenase [Thermoanaerobaculia bacterium]